MRSLQTEILVIGGGATGTGILRDLAMRGFKALLVERRDLCHGTTGRYHGLLHSGGRYVVKDPEAAKECIQENRILRRIMPHCIEDTGGFFVTTPWDDTDYAPRFFNGCHAAGIPVEEVAVQHMLLSEPALNPRISRCFHVPDGSADSFLAAESNVQSALEYGAQAFTYHEMLMLLRSGDRITGALCRDLIRDEEVQILADMVINASGAWAGKIAATAGLSLSIRPGKGVMVALSQRVVHTVINRCKMPSDGDILVPAHTVAIIGTTDETVRDPDHFAIEPSEIRLMLEEGEKLVPGFKERRVLRAWAGVRPLFQEGEDARGSTASRDLTRAFVLLDHAQRDGVTGLITITSGKWTTYRKMSEATVDKVCLLLNTQRLCRTHLETLPNPGDEAHSLGARLIKVEEKHTFGQTVCECELATVDQVRKSILDGKAKTIDDVRRDTRLGMGPCQGGFCTYRVAGLLQELRKPPVEGVNQALRDFLQERWKGLLPILWGQQLRQERLDELIYVNVLNVEYLAGDASSSRLASENYDTPAALAPLPKDPVSKSVFPYTKGSPTQPGSHPAPSLATENGRGQGRGLNTLVIGAGLAGLFTAWRCASSGLRTRLITKGWGALYWSSGCVDVFDPTLLGTGVDLSLPEGLEQLIHLNPHHPYTVTGSRSLKIALDEFKRLCAEVDYPMLGSLERNWRLPTALGTLRQTCLAPVTMLAGEASRPEPMLIVGFKGFLDFFPELVAANLNHLGLQAEALQLELPRLSGKNFVTGRVLGQAFDDPLFRREVIRALKPRLKGGHYRVGFPAVLGLNKASVWREMEARIGCPVFEIPGLPASIPGMRLHKILVDAIQQVGGQVLEGMQVIKAETAKSKVTAIWSEAAARLKSHKADYYVLATGGILGGGFQMNSDGTFYETIFNLPLQATPKDPFQREFLAAGGHPLFRVGLLTDHRMQPLDVNGQRIYQNLWVTGTLLGSTDPVRERSMEGIALASGVQAAEFILEASRGKN